MTEWEFTENVASWINVILSHNPQLPFSAAKLEQRGSGSNKRRDLTILDKSGRAVLTGEVKLPYSRDGGTPYNPAVVKDARAKAHMAEVDYFFTWNVNDCVLWETEPKVGTPRDHDYESWKVTSVHREGHMEMPMTESAITRWLPGFLHDVAHILRGTAAIGHLKPDEKFIERLESALKLPILLTLDELDIRYKKPSEKTGLDLWIREHLLRTITDDPDGIRDNLETTAKFACYTLVTKLVFYEALLKRFGSEMEKITVAPHITTGEDLRTHFEGYFAEAKKATGDYETVFGEDHTRIGNRIPFYPDTAVPHWRELVEQIHLFDFSQLDYEIIGAIFERLISPAERHKYGQYYTRVEVVDLILSFCIQTGEEIILDPACGGGTFLVRAYARKKECAPEQKHQGILADLYGADIEGFATQLTTINLATRELIDAENYPRIAHIDFFDVLSGKSFLSLPSQVKTKGLGESQHHDISIPPLDAIVGNPPYVRQEDIPKTKTKSKTGPETGTKEYYRGLVKHESGASLGGRSDLHCYFWPHAWTFLKDEGYLCFLTSSQWLDVEYGFRLQEWILENFELIAVFESVDEPWFVGARVATTVTILRKQPDSEKRMNNTVRFVQLRRSIAEILSHDGTTIGAVVAANRFRDEILGLTENSINGRYRVRLVKQSVLWNDGVALGALMSKSGGGGSEDEEPIASITTYYGGKWGVHLRAPDLWFQLLDEFGDKLVPLGQLAEVRFGVKSGNDAFFFPKDCSQDCLKEFADPHEFERTYKVPRKDVESGKVKLVACGTKRKDGRTDIKPIESKYLEPEVHSLMEVDGFTVTPEDCARMILLVGEKKSDIRDKHVLDYIKWGEKHGVDKASTCAARETPGKGWYDLTGHKRGTLFWPMAQQYKHAIPVNDSDLIANHNLFDLHIDKAALGILAGILNSTWVILSKFQYGRPVGVEGNLKTEVADVKMMLVPTYKPGPTSIRDRVSKAFEQLKTRKALSLLPERRLREMAYIKSGRESDLASLSDISEFEMPDRRELDDAVLEMMGVTSKKRRRELIDALYDYLREFFEATRQKEEKAIVNKNKTKRKMAASPSDVAAEIFEEIYQNEGRWLRSYRRDFLSLVRGKPSTTYELPKDGEPEFHEDILSPGGTVLFVKGKKQIARINTASRAQGNLLVLVAAQGVRGLIRFPHDETDCLMVNRAFNEFISLRESRLNELIQARTADPGMQEKIYEALLQRIAENH